MLEAFTRHPHSVDETYGQHFAHAASFGLPMIAAGFACLIHGLLPFAFVTTGSRCVAKLYGRMTGRAVPQVGYGEWEGAGV
jgi:hypothetical protein